MSIDIQDSEALDDIKDVIDFYDTKGDGRVRVDQLGTCLRCLDLCPTEAQIAQLSQRWTDPSERLSVENVAPIVKELRKEGVRDRSEAELTGFLGNFDWDNSGFVSSADLRHLLTRCGEPLSSEQYEQLIREERAEDGCVNIAELVRTISGKAERTDERVHREQRREGE
ncbi:hypothetical protein GPALN_006121 [Globodera pallida]|uniref:EF-hand domain-containing protein n=1 Tax=Globodera pallida TaxID=36090 RepID=A0A183BQ25_GLOPA|nr:hypothetical protein GPALN_006121 [Globodera pallida]